MPIDVVVHLGAQLPTILRGIYYSGWNSNKIPSEEKTQEEFFNKMQPDLQRLEVDAESSIKSIFMFLQEKLGEGQIHHIRGVLPKRLKELFTQ